MGPCASCAAKGQIYACGTGCDALADPGGALPPTAPVSPSLDPVAGFGALMHRFTQYVDEVRGLVLNDCLRLETIKLDGNGQGEVRVHVPYAGIAAWVHGTNPMTFSSTGLAASAPSVGIGVQVIAAASMAAWPATGNYCSIYGTAGDTVTVALYEKPIPPNAAGGGGGSSSGPSIAPADNLANPGAIPETLGFDLVWDEQNAQWVRARGRPLANIPGAVPSVARQEIAAFAYGSSPANGQIKGPFWVADVTQNLGNANGLLAAGVYLNNQGAGVYDMARSIGTAGDGVGTAAAMQPSSLPTEQTSAANTVNTITYGGVASQKHRLTMCVVSWSGAAATTGTLTVTDNATVVFSVDIPLALNTPYAVPLPPGGIVQAAVNTSLAISVAAGGAGAISKLNTAKLTA